MANDSSYQAEVSALDIALDVALGELRQLQDRGELNSRDAANARIVLLEDHLAKVRALRVAHFGGES